MFKKIDRVAGLALGPLLWVCAAGMLHFEIGDVWAIYLLYGWVGSLLATNRPIEFPVAKIIFWYCLGYGLYQVLGEPFGDAVHVTQLVFGNYIFLISSTVLVILNVVEHSKKGTEEQKAPELPSVSDPEFTPSS